MLNSTEKMGKNPSWLVFFFCLFVFFCCSLFCSVYFSFWFSQLTEITPVACARSDAVHHRTPRATEWTGMQREVQSPCAPPWPWGAEGWPLTKHRLLGMPLGQHANWKQRAFCLQPPSPSPWKCAIMINNAPWESFKVLLATSLQ